MTPASACDRDADGEPERSAAVIYVCCVHALAAAGAAMLATRFIPWVGRCMRRHWRVLVLAPVGALRLAWRVIRAGRRCCHPRRRSLLPPTTPVALRKGRALHCIMHD